VPTFEQEVTVSGPRIELEDRSRWRARPALSRALSLSVFVVPVAGSYVVTRLLSPLVAGLPVLSRVIALGVIAVAVGLVAERVLRRVLPLAALLRMTMLFPDRAPSRFKLARAAGNTGILTERARTHPDETAGEAATRILGLLTSLSAHDRRTRGHSERVRVFTDVLADELHLPQQARDRLRWAALLHDLGKVDVPASVLNKPAALDADEWTMIRRHPDRGAALAGPLLEWLGEWGAAISEHHERFDGKGYPRGLAGHDIAPAGRIVAVADVFEVMTAARSYKRPMTVRAARRELAEVAGTQLDPACVRAFLGASLPRVLWAVGPLALLVNLPFLRGLAEVGRVVEQASAAAAGQAATAAAAATAAVVVMAGPATSPVAAADQRSEPRTTGHAGTSAPGPSRATSVSTPRRTAGPAGHHTPSAGSTPSPSPSRSSPQPSPTSTSTAAPGSASGTTPSAHPTSSATAPPATHPSATAASSATPTPTSSASPTASSSPSSTASSSGGGQGSGEKPATPAIAGPLLVLLQPVTFTFASTDSGVTFQCRMDGDQWSTCTSPVSYSGLKIGKHRLEVQAVDSSGDTSDKARFDFTVV
jgi:HD-GYP domain-containing protein (c-di-GMP phosphodiesterase class II)